MSSLTITSSPVTATANELGAAPFASLPALSERPASLRAASFLAPALFPTYQRILEHLGAHVGLHVSLTASAPVDDLRAGHLDLAFLCGLQYVRVVDAIASMGEPPPVEVLGAPVLGGQRYNGRPIYFSDIVVPRESPYTCLDDLAGRRFAYNERSSHSGYVLVQYSLLTLGHTGAYFGDWIETGAHARSLEMVASGDADAAAIDSHVLSVLLERDVDLAACVRVVGSFGPSTMPPLVVRRDLDADLKRDLRDALVGMHADSSMQRHLRAGLIDRFVTLEDHDYDDIRTMQAMASASVDIAR